MEKLNQKIKQILFVLALFWSISGFAQTATFTDILMNKRGNYDQYISPDNGSFKVGDTLTLGKPATGKYFSCVGFHGLLGETLISADINDAGSKAVIKRIVIQYNILTIKTFKPLLSNASNFGFNINNLEIAIANGEIICNVISSEDALTKLETERKKLDLGVIKPEQYEIKKKEFMKYIK